jgi:hypothetical protein
MQQPEKPSDAQQALRFFLLKAAIFIGIPVLAAAIAAARILLQ